MRPSFVRNVAASGDGDEAVIGEAHPVSVAAEVLEESVGASRRASPRVATTACSPEADAGVQSDQRTSKRVPAGPLVTRVVRCHDDGVTYRSPHTLFGLPLVHVSIGSTATSRRGIAVGWVAVGDVAVGILIGVGGVAGGVLALGGVAVGSVALGGLAVGALATGGLAVGWLAAGGAAIGVAGALGGLAVARDVAFGGAALAAHANDDVAREMASRGFFRASSSMLEYSIILVALPAVLGLAQRLALRRRRAS